ncbi:MAG TPA: hypothetical protein PKL29_09705 [Methanothrix sp.]|nr:hypothetical protein [Methanothrix sp.]
MSFEREIGHPDAERNAELLEAIRQKGREWRLDSGKIHKIRNHSKNFVRKDLSIQISMHLKPGFVDVMKRIYLE